MAISAERRLIAETENASKTDSTKNGQNGKIEKEDDITKCARSYMVTQRSK